MIGPGSYDVDVAKEGEKIQVPIFRFNIVKVMILII